MKSHCYLYQSIRQHKNLTKNIKKTRNLLIIAQMHQILLHFETFGK